jgi:DNA polymerase I
MTPQLNRKLFLLDAMALIYRAYFAFSKNPRYNSKGLNTSAILGFTNTLTEILNKEKPTHIAVAFDTDGPTERHTDFTAYKAHREAMPEDISRAIPYIIELLNGFNIPVVVMEGYEADDIIGTLSKQAEKEGFRVYMMTPDKDFGQLVSENIFIYKPARMGNDVEIMGIPEVLKKFEIQHVDQVRDLLGLWGDSSDNIPGIPGVGEKTAKQLISQFGSVESIIANAAQIPGKLREKVEQFADQAILSKKLATIICHVPLNLSVDSFAIQEPNREALSNLFNELEFRTLARRILGEAPESSVSRSAPPAARYSNGQESLFADTEVVEVAAPTLFDTEEEPKIYNTVKTVEHAYHLITTPEQRRELIASLSGCSSICFDTETTDIDANCAELVGISFSVKPHEAFYVPFPEDQEAARQIIHEFREILENPDTEKIGQNIKYDILVLKCYGIHVQGRLFDTMLAHYLLEPDMRHNMTVMSENYLNYTPVPIESLIGARKNGQLSMRSVSIEQLVEYACEDADITLQLRNVLAPLLDRFNARKLFSEVEIPLVNVLADMESEGVLIDTAALGEFSTSLQTDILHIEQEIYSAAGSRFNISSPKQLGDILFEVLKIDDKAKKTKTKQYATGEEVLIKLVNKHPIVPMILDYRQLLKLKNTYVDTLPAMINKRTGRVHTSYNQAVAATGRLSSNNPNLQNIPIRTEKGREVRKAFIPRDSGRTLLSADYSQIELRIIAELSGDETMQEAFIKGLDIHTATAAKVYGVPLDQVSSEMRRNAKMVNFGIIYGISSFGLSQRLNIPKKEAAFIIDQYFLQYSGVKRYMDESIQRAREQGFVETILGRRRYLKDINSHNAVVRGFAERNAINAPIQGSAADMIKVAMIHIHKDLSAKKLDTKMILQVHDELVFDVPHHEIEVIKPIIAERMKNAIKTRVPLEVEMGSGKNWLEAH